MNVSHNRLAAAASPYLRQHASNPVWWYPWGDEAFRAARDQQKPIFLSIGYSTCYWCHVMEDDSFETEQVASVLNAHFVSIKVDREERPDVDQVYMDAVVGLTGHGGWPMSVFLTPDLKPFWGGTFFPRDRFLQILRALAEAWHSDREKVLASAAHIVDAIRPQQIPRIEANIDADLLIEVFDSYSRNFDRAWGGFGAAPKFPPSQQVSLLLRLSAEFSDAERRASALEMACVTLKRMARGGMFDHLGGGFHRYSTDERWIVPHFEKMLYDNALLASVYVEAYQRTGEDFYRGVAEDILCYVLRDMSSPEGGFFAAEDAGEVGQEGEFYVWTAETLEKVLSASECELARRVYNVTPAGNFERGSTICTLNDEFDWSIKRAPEFAPIQAKLLRERQGRVRPARDEKIITAWNGLMIAALARAFQVFGEERYLQAARGAASFIQGKLWREGALYRSVCGGVLGPAACADDYVFLVHGLLRLYQASFDAAWLQWAETLQAAQDEIFWDGREGGYFYSCADELVVRKKELYDGATPAANSVAIENLFTLSLLAAEPRYDERARNLLRFMGADIRRIPSAFPRACSAVVPMLKGGTAVGIVGGDSHSAALRSLWSAYAPDLVLASQTGAGESAVPFLKGKCAISAAPTLYVCRHGTCEPGIVDSLAARQSILASLAAESIFR